MSVLAPKGMRDFLPKEKEMRNYILGIIRDEYSRNGFSEIETSEIENLENMEGAQSGENAKLIFKILKRGDKLDFTKQFTQDSDVADLALRFDLTLPLSRFYAANRNNLPQIFKVIQIGNVFRAERPQKGRYRSFVQCDIDIIGDESVLAEIELINTICGTLKRLQLDDSVIKINDRRILRDICAQAGFDEDNFDDILITLDKLDKIAEEGVIKELESKGYSKENIDKLISINKKVFEDKLEFFKEINPDAYSSLSTIITAIKSLNNGIAVEFDHTLVRGMGYYTGTIFEIHNNKFNSALGGGGRYDKMIGKLSGVDAPACGFSIGFERIADLLANSDFQYDKLQKIAIFYDDNANIADVINLANNLRENANVSVFQKKKKFSKQVDRLVEQGFDSFAVFSSENSENLELKSLS